MSATDAAASRTDAPTEGRNPLNQHRGPKLTTRELECIRLIAQGLSAHDAAAELGIASRTVERHLDQARLKLNAKNRVHLVAKAIKKRIIEAGE